MELDRQSIERRDFPIGRRGYAPAAVDAHLQALAGAVQELQSALAGRGADSLAASAGTQVQAIVAAAEVAAEEIESEANANAQRTRAEAQADAERTRAEAVAQAQAHVAAVGRATATLLARVQSLDGETGALVESLRAGATRLAGDLATVETNMGELYDAAAGRSAGGETTSPAAPEPVVAIPGEARTPVTPLPERPPEAPPEPVVAKASPEPVAAKAPSIPAPAAVENGDLDGVRLVALNMALNGDSREETDRYLAEHYQVADRAKLLDEVYAAIEG